MHSLQGVFFLIRHKSFSLALIRSFLTSGGAADAAEFEITSYCVEKGFTHVVSSWATTA